MLQLETNDAAWPLVTTTAVAVRHVRGFVATGASCQERTFEACDCEWLPRAVPEVG